MRAIRGGGNRSTELLFAQICRHQKLVGWRRHAYLPGRPDFILKKQQLGQDLHEALEWRFDLHKARSSLAFFDLRTIPAIRRPIPAAVSGVRFITNLESCSEQKLRDLQGLDAEARQILPAR